jgi:cellulose biosynthesis protein BcsQ
MVGLVITIAQRKGGARKTTFTTQLAVAWARCGARVAALDIDPQAASRLGSICAGRGSGQRRSVLILRHCLAGARRNGSTIESVRRIWS